MAKITYSTKVALNTNQSIADENKVNAADMNEIKSIVNSDADAIGTGTDSWSSSNTYLTGDIASYENAYYKNTTGTNTATSPDSDSTNWEGTNLVSILGNRGYIFDSGSNSNGSYIKYSDGTMICYKKVTGSADITTAWGSLYTSSSVSLGNWAATFSTAPVASVYAQCQSGTQYMLSTSNVADTTGTTSAGSVTLIRPSSRSGTAYILYCIGIGKWR